MPSRPVTKQHVDEHPSIEREELERVKPLLEAARKGVLEP